MGPVMTNYDYDRRTGDFITYIGYAFQFARSLNALKADRDTSISDGSPATISDLILSAVVISKKLNGDRSETFERKSRSYKEWSAILLDDLCSAMQMAAQNSPELNMEDITRAINWYEKHSIPALRRFAGETIN